MRGISARIFWMLLVVELGLLAGVLAWFLGFVALPPTPLVSPELVRVRAAITDRLAGAVHDPLIELRPGLSARESNLRGFSLGGAVYYYYLDGAHNFDPLSRGAVSADQIEIVFRDEEGPQTLVIYRVRQ